MTAWDKITAEDTRLRAMDDDEAARAADVYRAWGVFDNCVLTQIKTKQESVALQRIVKLSAALDACEKVLNANFATPHTIEGRRAIAAINLARAALSDDNGRDEAAMWKREAEARAGCKLSLPEE